MEDWKGLPVVCGQTGDFQPQRTSTVVKESLERRRSIRLAKKSMQKGTGLNSLVSEVQDIARRHIY
jgi:hypothetical protein